MTIPSQRWVDDDEVGDAECQPRYPWITALIVLGIMCMSAVIVLGVLAGVVWLLWPRHS